jgi:hypothetical protein
MDVFQGITIRTRKHFLESGKATAEVCIQSLVQDGARALERILAKRLPPPPTSSSHLATDILC